MMFSRRRLNIKKRFAVPLLALGIAGWSMAGAGQVKEDLGAFLLSVRPGELIRGGFSLKALAPKQLQFRGKGLKAFWGTPACPGCWPKPLGAAHPRR